MGPRSFLLMNFMVLILNGGVGIYTVIIWQKLGLNTEIGRSVIYPRQSPTVKPKDLSSIVSIRICSNCDR